MGIPSGRDGQDNKLQQDLHCKDYNLWCFACQGHLFEVNLWLVICLSVSIRLFLCESVCDLVGGGRPFSGLRCPFSNFAPSTLRQAPCQQRF